ncbi:MAG: histidine kinase N-terminal 7TM domain-containing protein, partial [Candidatus Omnitrophota bacterium]
MGEIFNLQNYRFNIYAVPNFVVAFLFIFLGLFVFYKNQKSPVSRTFLLMAVMAFIWQFVYGIAYLSVNENVANILLRIGYGGVIFIPVVNCHFGASFLKDRKQIMIIYASYVLGAIFFVFLLTTNLFMTGVYKYFWGYYPKVSILHPLYLVTLLGITVYALMSTLWRVYMRARKEKNYVLQNQSKYVFLALLTYWLAAVDFVPNYHIEIYPFGNLFVIGCISILFYTIVRHRLMEIDTVIHKTALWLLTLLLVILPVGLLVTFSMDWIASLGRVAKLALTSVVLIFFVWYYSKLKPYVDHLFRRRKYDYYQVLGEIGQKIGSELDINNVV